MELQSFIDAAWASFRESTPCTRGVPEAVRRAQWMRDAFYTLTSEFLVKKSFESKMFAHRLVNGVFVPLLAQPSGHSVEDDNADRAAEQTMRERIQGMCLEVLSTFEQALWDRWEVIARQSRFRGRRNGENPCMNIRIAKQSFAASSVRQREPAALLPRKFARQPSYPFCSSLMHGDARASGSLANRERTMR